MHLLSVAHCGAGDSVVLAHLAEGARRSGLDVRFETGRNDGILRLFSQTIESANPNTPAWDFNAKDVKGEAERLRPGGRWHESFAEAVPFLRGVRPVRPPAAIGDEAREWAWRLVHRSRGDDEVGPVVLLFPSACYGSRVWPLASYLRLAWALRQAGYNTIALDSSAEKLRLFPFYTAGQSWERIAALMELADVTVSNESGPAHVAGTLDRPALVLCGPSDPKIILGAYRSVSIVRTRPSRVPCVGCHWRGTRGYAAPCDLGCEALMALDWREVYRRLTRRTPLTISARGAA